MIVLKTAASRPIMEADGQHQELASSFRQAGLTTTARGSTEVAMKTKTSHLVSQLVNLNVRKRRTSQRAEACACSLFQVHQKGEGCTNK